MPTLLHLHLVSPTDRLNMNVANIGSLLSSQLRRADGNSSTPSPLPQLPPLALSSFATPVVDRMAALHAEVQARLRCKGASCP